MKVVVEYRMKAYIEADNLHECSKLWDNADLEMCDDTRTGRIETILIDMMSIYDEDTEEDIEFKDFK